MPIRYFSLTGAALALTLLAAGGAAAQGRHIRHLRVAHVHHRLVLAEVSAPPLTVRKRSFLDPGNVVEVGADNEYLTANTTEHQPIYTSFAPARFGESTLPGRFDLPYNPRFEPGNNIDFMTSGW